MKLREIMFNELGKSKNSILDDSRDERRIVHALNRVERYFVYFYFLIMTQIMILKIFIAHSMKTNKTYH